MKELDIKMTVEDYIKKHERELLELKKEIYFLKQTVNDIKYDSRVINGNYDFGEGY